MSDANAMNSGESLDVFGDESASGDFVSYAVVCIPSNKAAELGDQIVRLRATHGVEKFHCRILFNPEQRKKAGLSHLSTPDVIDIYGELAALLTPRDLRIAVARGRLSDFPNPFPAAPPFPRIKFTDKTMGVFCANSALVPVQRDFTGPTIHLWPDEDQTISEWLGRRMKTSSAIGGYYGGSSFQNERLSPRPLRELPDDGRGALFDVADATAWLSNRVMTGRTSNLHGGIVKLYSRYNPMEVSIGRWRDGGMTANVPNEWPLRP